MTHHSFSQSLASCRLPEEVLDTGLTIFHHKQSWYILSQGLPCYQFIILQLYLIFLFRELWHIVWTISNKMEYAFANVTPKNFLHFYQRFFCLSPLFLPLSLYLPPLSLYEPLTWPLPLEVSFIASHIWLKCFL